MRHLSAVPYFTEFNRREYSLKTSKLTVYAKENLVKNKDHLNRNKELFASFHVIHGCFTVYLLLRR